MKLRAKHVCFTVIQKEDEEFQTFELFMHIGISIQNREGMRQGGGEVPPLVRNPHTGNCSLTSDTSFVFIKAIANIRITETEI